MVAPCNRPGDPTYNLSSWPCFSSVEAQSSVVAGSHEPPARVLKGPASCCQRTFCDQVPGRYAIFRLGCPQ